MISTFILFIILTFSVSPQVSGIQHIFPNTIEQNIATFDQTYMDGCKAVLQAKDNLYEQDPKTWKTTYSNWENTNSFGFLQGFFDNDKGIVSKTWNSDTASWSGGWAFNLTFYDGEVIDGKFILVEFSIAKIQPGDFNQSIGNFTKFASQDFHVYASYGEDDQIQNRDDIQGQLFINFFDTSAQQPISSFDIGFGSLQGDTVLITFISDDDSLSFTTSLFTDAFPVIIIFQSYHIEYLKISQDDTNLVYILTLLYVICSLYSANTSELVPQLSFGSLVGTYTASSFIVLWAFLHMPLKTNFLYFLPFIGTIIDWIKQAIFLLSRSSCSSSCGAIFVSTFFACILSFLPTIWVNLLPALALLFPLFAKISSQNSRRKHYLTKYQLSYWICVSIWMGYFYCSPNIYLISPQPLLAKTFFGIILFQFVLSFLMHKMQTRNPQPLLPQIRRQIHEAEPISQPRNNFKYTFAAQQGGDYTELTDECVICHDLLLGDDNPDKLYKTPCGHIFHENCLRGWGVKKLNCPSCRKTLPAFKRAIN